MNSFQIDKAGATKVLTTSGWVGLAAAITYLATHLDQSVWGSAAPIIGAALAIATKFLTQWALPEPQPNPQLVERLEQANKISESLKKVNY